MSLIAPMSKPRVFEKTVQGVLSWQPEIATIDVFAGDGEVCVRIDLFDTPERIVRLTPEVAKHLAGLLSAAGTSATSGEPEGGTDA